MLKYNILILYCNGFDQRVAGNNSVNTVQHAKIDEAVFSTSSAPSNDGTTGLCNPFLSNSSVYTLLRKQ
jgi:hypothetical protein